MAFSIDELIFPAHAVSAPGPLPPGAKRFSIDAAGGAELHGVHIPPVSKSRGGGTLVIGFGGNAWNGEDVGSYLHEAYPDADVVAFHYRGYRPSTGSPSADALVSDAPFVLETAMEQVKAKRVVVVGFSIGTGIAASLAKSGKVDGMILVTPFDSLKSVAQDLYPFVPGIGLLFRHELDSAEFLKGSKVPVAIVAAELDQIILPRRTDSLRARVPNLVYDRSIAGAGHNDIYARSDFLQAMDEAFEAVTA
ncbi:MAG: alpha/beta fold hydrolase [Sphingomonas sp.]|nr:alpha/beta fold hydrolase [Sphingomonas sp.]